MKQPKHQIVIAWVLLAVLFSANCAPQRPPSNTIVLQYQELGPQVLVYPLIGYEWYQWNSQGGDDPAKFDDVKVVVYRNLPLETVKEMYPVIKEKQDYRYLDYSTAMDYLNQNENEPYLDHLRTTKKKIIAQLGS